MTFGQKVKEIREAQGLTQLELAKQAGLHRTQIQRYETDTGDPSLLSALCIAEALGVSLDTLAGRFG